MHLAIKEQQIASEYLAIHDRQITSMSYQTNYLKKEYFFMFYHIHGTFKFKEFFFSYLCMYLILIPTM
jgi:hypothetical protein